MDSAGVAIESDELVERLLAVVRRHWGFSSLRPLQAEAMRAVLARRDSLLVLPTGGGKSLCYQAPAVLTGETTVVVSPLIAVLMKDQVDALRANGVPAVQLNSAISPEEARDAEREVLAGRVRLLFVSPERMVMPAFRRLVQQAGVRTFAIDEAHCISHWGHDFRPEYRQLREIKQVFPEASVHGFTATATTPVRQDIVDQLALRDAAVLVGHFDRPNLNYRVIRRDHVLRQALDCLTRHRSEAGIIYCIRRRDVDELTKDLQQCGVDARPYHAGMNAAERKAVQEAFTAEQCDVVVATVAFGMGIDRSNVRFVLHTGMPKSIEHYQQETGRAGRDGLEAECLLLTSGEDAMIWRSLVDKTIAEAEHEVDPQYRRVAMQHIDDMESFCRPVVCRHRALVEYFGQTYEGDNCGACDVCLGDGVPVSDAQTVAKKILSCVARVKESFGVRQVISVLRGEATEAVLRWGHEKLSTFGLLSEHRDVEIRDWIAQLVAQHVLLNVALENKPDVRVLKLNPASWEVMRDQRQAKLMQTVTAKRKRKRGVSDLAALATEDSGPRDTARRSRAEVASWEGVDQELFERLRTVRRKFADQRGLPPFVIFSDVTLRDLARRRPSSLEAMRGVYGIGEAKLAEFGAEFLRTIDDECQARGLSRDIEPSRSAAPAIESPLDIPPELDRPTRPSRSLLAASEMFRRGASVEDVMRALARARSTVMGYLNEFVAAERPASIAQWVDDATYQRVEAALDKADSRLLKPIFDALGGEIPYDAIRLVITHRRAHGRDRLPPLNPLPPVQENAQEGTAGD